MESNFITLGTATNHYSDRSVSLSHDARLRHTFVIGQTGTGKSSLLERMAVDDMNAGNGLAFFDPHGDSARNLCNYVPAHRMRDVIYVRPADLKQAFGFNIFGLTKSVKKDRLTQEIVGTFRYRWADSWGARMDNIFKHTVRALLDIPPRRGGATLLSVPLFLHNKAYRKWVLSWSESHAVQNFFRDEFDRWNERQVSEYVQPILNKVDQFLLSDVLVNVIGQTKSTIDLEYIMDNRKILIVDLDKGAIGKDDAEILGSLLVTGFQMAAMRRSGLPAKDRVPFYCYLDEFHSFTTGAFTSILSESRKYGLGLVLAGQYLSQIEHKEVKDAVKGNCGNYVCFRVGDEDAKELSPTLDYPAHLLEDLPTGKAAVRYLDRGQPTTTDLVTSLINPAYRQKRNRHGSPLSRVLKASERYTTPIDVINERNDRLQASIMKIVN